MPQVSIARLFEDNRDKLKLAWIAGRDGGTKDLNSELTKDSSKGLIGHLNFIHPNLIQVLGQSEVGYLDSLERTACAQTLNEVATRELACFIVAGVDNNPTRRHVAEYAIAHNIPAIFAAVSRGGNEAYTFIQRPRAACWGCAFPTYLDDTTFPCQLPGIIDVLHIVAAEVVFAIDVLLADRPCQWALRETFLDGSLPDRVRRIERKPDCRLCGYVT